MGKKAAKKQNNKNKFSGMQPVNAQDLIQEFDGDQREVLPSWLVSSDDPNAKLYAKELASLPILTEADSLDAEWAKVQRSQPAAVLLLD